MQNLWNTLIQSLILPPDHSYPVWLAVIALGLVIGSFLNVVIYRLSLQMKGTPSTEIGVTKPARSFCPDCKAELSWYENIPVLSYLAQKGACRHCKKAIPARYPLVELGGAAALAIPWLLAPNTTMAISGSILLLAMLAASVIDMQTQKIPDKISLPTLAILLGLAFLPGGIGTVAVNGAGGLFLVMLFLVELGKKLFGTKKVILKECQNMRWDGNNLTIQEPGKTMEESEPTTRNELPFSRPKDKITMWGTFLIGDSTVPKTTVEISAHSTTPITGELKSICFPREAMGMGDAKLMAMIGAGIGFVGAIQGLWVGAILALLYILIGRFVALSKKKNAPGLIAFGPWICAGCAIVMLHAWGVF